MKRIKTKFRTVKKYADADPKFVSGTILRLMRKNSPDPKWKQVSGKEVRRKHRESKKGCPNKIKEKRNE